MGSDFKKTGSVLQIRSRSFCTKIARLAEPIIGIVVLIDCVYRLFFSSIGFNILRVCILRA